MSAAVNLSGIGAANLLSLLMGPSELGLAILRRAAPGAADRGSLRLLWIVIFAAVFARFISPTLRHRCSCTPKRLSWRWA